MSVRVVCKVGRYGRVYPSQLGSQRCRAVQQVRSRTGCVETMPPRSKRPTSSKMVSSVVSGLTSDREVDLAKDDLAYIVVHCERCKHTRAAVRQLIQRIVDGGDATDQKILPRGIIRLMHLQEFVVVETLPQWCRHDRAVLNSCDDRVGLRNLLIWALGGDPKLKRPNLRMKLCDLIAWAKTRAGELGDRLSCLEIQDSVIDWNFNVGRFVFVPPDDTERVCTIMDTTTAELARIPEALEIVVADVGEKWYIHKNWLKVDLGSSDATNEGQPMLMRREDHGLSSFAIAPWFCKTSPRVVATLAESPSSGKKRRITPFTPRSSSCAVLSDGATSAEQNENSKISSVLLAGALQILERTKDIAELEDRKLSYAVLSLKATASGSGNEKGLVENSEMPSGGGPPAAALVPPP